MLAEVIFRRDARSVTESSDETLIAPVATLVAVMVRNPRAAINFAISGGGATYSFIDSVVNTAGTVALENDEASPSASKYYGTDSGAVRGYHPLPTISFSFPDSVVNVGGAITLENDQVTPPSQQYYGTDATGARGYHQLPVNPAQSGSYLISGGGVVWSGTGYVYHVAATVYVINGVQYSSAATDVTLAASDPTNDRIDLIVVNASGAVVVITGTPGGPPVQPQIDPATQLDLTFIYVPAASSAPIVTTEDIYHENTEWTTSVSANINAASTNNPHAGTKDIEATSAVSGNFVSLVRPSGTLKPSDYTSLSFWIRNKASWPNQKSISIFFQLGASNVGTTVTLKNGTFGFNGSDTTNYQLIVVPVANFNTGSSSVDRVRFAVAGGGGAIGWYIDDIILQSGGGGGGTGNGDFSTNTNVSVAGEIVLFADATGKLGGRSTGTGLAKLTSGVLGTAGEGTDYLGVARIDDTAYDATTWNGDATHAPSKNAVRDKIESLAGGGITANQKLSGLSFSAYKSAGIVTGKVRGFWVAPYAGNIVAWNLTVDVGTITIKFWKIATGTAHPTNANSINTSGVSLSTGTSVRSTTLTDFTTVAVAAGDIFAVEITAVAGGMLEVSGGLEIQKT